MKTPGQRMEAAGNVAALADELGIRRKLLYDWREKLAGGGAEKRIEAGQAWSETPPRPHYMVNASRTEPVQLVMVQIPKAGTKAFKEFLPK